VLNFSTTHAIIEQLLVESSLDSCLSQHDLLPIPCDKDKFCDNAYAVPTNNHAICVLEPNTCAESKHVIHIASDKDVLQLLSSLINLGYIEFDILCNLNCLEERLFGYADLPWFSRHTYADKDELAEFFGRDDTIENWKHDHIPSHNYFGFHYFRNLAFLCVVQDQFSAQWTPKTAFCQEEEDDEDTRPKHMTMIGAWHRKGVQQGCPSKEGGSRLIQFDSPSWRPQAIQVRAHLGVQDQNKQK
jgi:hypothetical protein